ncbi:BT_3928 family protein [Limibacter armeniacum]|uniref:BT_3928 family protein n=1 Tax=Limibacter armeniacum TaxID=466084 RepID=UPI002FE569D6
MKTLNKLLTFFVGATFIFSGAVKIIDPKGTAIKLEEYFYVFAADVADSFPALESLFTELMPYALVISVVLSTMEVVLGAALLTNFYKKVTLRLLLLLLAFFGFLTFYSAYFNRVTDCGCFGDFIKFSPWGSFTKDMILLTASLLLLIHPSSKDNFKTPLGGIFTFLATAASLSVGIYAIRHLPPIDFRVYAVGANIPELMQPAEQCEYLYIMEKDGETVEMKQYPTDPSYKYKEMRILNEEACKPKITDYAVSSLEGDDVTQATLTGKSLLIIIHDTKKADKTIWAGINELCQDAKEAGIHPMILTSDASGITNFAQQHNLTEDIYLSDATVLKTMIRSNPGIILMEDGVVKGKWHYNDTPQIEEVGQLLIK